MRFTFKSEIYKYQVKVDTGRYSVWILDGFDRKLVSKGKFNFQKTLIQLFDLFQLEDVFIFALTHKYFELSKHIILNSNGWVRQEAYLISENEGWTEMQEWLKSD